MPPKPFFEGLGGFFICFFSCRITKYEMKMKFSKEKSYF